MTTILDRGIAPPVTIFSDIALSDERVEHLDNGAVFHTINYGEQPLSRLSLMWQGGRLDTQYKSLPLLLTEAIRENSTNVSGAEIADILDFNGARLSSRCADHHSGIELIALNSRLGALLPLLSEIISNPNFDEQTVEMITRRAAARRAVQQAKVAYAASMRVVQAIAGSKHPVAVAETPEIIKSISPNHLRQAYSDIIAPGRLHVYLAGKFDDDVIGLVRNFILNLPARSSDKSIINVVPYQAEAPGRFAERRSDSLQSAVSMALPTISRNHPDYIDLRMSVIALGGYFSSRLMSNIREEKGLTYGIGSALIGSLEGAYMTIDAQCDAAYVEQVIEETCNEIKGLSSNPLGNEELNRVKMHAWSMLANAADSSFAMSDYYMTRLLVATPDDYFTKQLLAIRQLTSERIAEISAQYLNPENLRIGIVGA